MSVPLTEQRILQIRSGNRCAFPGCGAPLVKPGTFGTRPVVIGEIAHIVSETPDGPRGKHYLPAGQHNKHTNLIFLCSPHHTEVDTQPEIYTVERLKQMKRDHEDAVEVAVAQTKLKEKLELVDLPLITEVVHSTLLPVIRMPRYIFSAPCKYGDSQEKQAIKNVLLAETPFRNSAIPITRRRLHGIFSLVCTSKPEERLGGQRALLLEPVIWEFGSIGEWVLQIRRCSRV